MTQPTPTPPLRNAPCPCGSGKKYKHCCSAAKPVAVVAAAPASRKSQRDLWLIALGMVAIVAACVFALIAVGRRPSSMSRPAPTAVNPGPVPKPYEFDAANNRHWDPTHGHWHDGPPPPGTAAK